MTLQISINTCPQSLHIKFGEILFYGFVGTHLLYFVRLLMVEVETL